MTDSDLAGNGSAAVTVVSSTETTPEAVKLTETPAGSGHFQGVVATSPTAPVGGDGKISVVDGDTIDVRYVDASSCGTPNVAVDKTARIDCVVPSLSNVQATPGTNFGTITWNTSEAATSVVHYGPSLPPALSASAAGMASTHSVTLAGLAECTSYYYWVESADAAGNTINSNASGGTFAFTTGQHHQASFTSTDTPLSIPDNNPTGAQSTIAVAGGDIVQDVNVTANITHTFDGDLTLSLITPASTTITLALRRGGSANNYRNTIFDDEAQTPIASGTPPFTGSFKPESPLSAADGVSGAGNWRFKVVDLANADVGTIDNWTLNLSYPDAACVPLGSPPPVPDGSFGVAMTASRVNGDGSVVHLDWDVATCAAKNNHLLFGALQNVASCLPSGGVCGLGPLGSYDWSAVPAGDLWFLVVSDDAASTEGSWGTDGGGGERNGLIGSGLCGFTARSNSGTCP
jgi:subtilisin-like proprotein convertase family protein